MGFIRFAVRSGQRFLFRFSITWQDPRSSAVINVAALRSRFFHPINPLAVTNFPYLKGLQCLRHHLYRDLTIFHLLQTSRSLTTSSEPDVFTGFGLLSRSPSLSPPQPLWVVKAIPSSTTTKPTHSRLGGFYGQNTLICALHILSSRAVLSLPLWQCFLPQSPSSHQYVDTCKDRDLPFPHSPPLAINQLTSSCSLIRELSS